MTQYMDESLIPSQSPQYFPSTMRNRVALVTKMADLHGLPTTWLTWTSQLLITQFTCNRRQSLAISRVLYPRESMFFCGKLITWECFHYGVQVVCSQQDKMPNLDLYLPPCSFYFLQQHHSQTLWDIIFVVKTIHTFLPFESSFFQ